MISVSQAIQIINETRIPLRTQSLSLEQSIQKIIAEDIKADRDFPPYDRVTMDGIAISFKDLEKGNNTFEISHRQLAGAPQSKKTTEGSCIEVMTGSINPLGMDTIIKYEDVVIEEKEGKKLATIINETVKKGQNIHFQGSDRKKGSLLIPKFTQLESAEIAVAATVGHHSSLVVEEPRIAIVSTGDELIPIHESPKAHQIRRSNGIMIQALLQEQGMGSDVFHFPDIQEEIKTGLLKIEEEYDICILSGGVSMGKADFIPTVLKEIGIIERFHKVKQRPGKPFWFGHKRDCSLIVFGLPGNPVSSFVGVHKYILPWLKKQLGLTMPSMPLKARLKEDFSFDLPLTYFLQVNITQAEDGVLEAHPYVGGGSGDLANLLYGNGLLELPQEQQSFAAGSFYPLIAYRRLF